MSDSSQLTPPDEPMDERDAVVQIVGRIVDKARSGISYSEESAFVDDIFSAISKLAFSEMTPMPEGWKLAIPAGWKLVPIEPTAEMLAAGGAAVLPEPSRADVALARKAAPMVMFAAGTVRLNLHVEAIAGMIATMPPFYRAMVAAAPKLENE